MIEGLKQMGKADMSTCRNTKDRSRKTCVCGGHNLNNVKKNKLHNATKKRLQIRQARKKKWQLLEVE